MSTDNGNTPAKRYFRKIIRITALDSPNVQRGLKQRAKGQVPDDEIVIPGVITYGQYEMRLHTYDIIRRTVGLWARFYEGAEILLYPPEWLDRAALIAEELERTFKPGMRKAKSIGFDSARGGDSSSWIAIDDLGILDIKTMKTPNTAVIMKETMDFARMWGCEGHQCWFDAGGGGYEHADYLREFKKFRVNVIGFGESIAMDPKRGLVPIASKKEHREVKYSYVNRRAQMYHMLHLLLDPAREELGLPIKGFGIPSRYTRLRAELAPVPKLYDQEGRIWMLPKDTPDPKRTTVGVDTTRTLKQLIGWSPDESDALVLAVYGLTAKVRRFRISAS